MHKTRAAVLILFLASTLAFGGCLVRQQTGKTEKGRKLRWTTVRFLPASMQRSQNFWPE